MRKQIFLILLLFAILACSTTNEERQTAEKSDETQIRFVLNQKGHYASSDNLFFSPDAKRLITASHDKKIIVKTIYESSWKTNGLKLAVSTCLNTSAPTAERHPTELCAFTPRA